MRRFVIAVALTGACMLALGVLRVSVDASVRADEGTQARGRGNWTIPKEAPAEKNPLTVNDGVRGAGRKLFMAKCQRCHGPEGKGDGPDADSNFADRMDLRLVSRAAENPDGVVFYKIWNGRTQPKMPAFSEELSREQVWAIVSYVQSIRTVK
jgi:mono/diheme cytochrome c family protein